MPVMQTKLTIAADLETDELAILTQQLHQELLDLDVEDVQFMKEGELPVGTKTGDPISWGELLITLAASGGIITTLLNFLYSWTTRHDNMKLIIEINGNKLELAHATSEEKQAFIKIFTSQINAQK